MIERGILLLSPAHGRVAAEGAVGGDQEVDVVPPLRVLGEHAAAAVLDVVGVRADGEDIHTESAFSRLGKRLGGRVPKRLRRPRVPRAQDGESLIAVDQ